MPENSRSSIVRLRRMYEDLAAQCQESAAQLEQLHTLPVGEAHQSLLAAVIETLRRTHAENIRVLDTVCSQLDEIWGGTGSGP